MTVGDCSLACSLGRDTDAQPLPMALVLQETRVGFDPPSSPLRSKLLQLSCRMIAIQPPVYFPPLAYTALLHQVDHFVLADTFRYRCQSFQNRSKLRNAQGAHWITIPLFGRPEGARLQSVEIETSGRWREKHWRSFLYDYRTTMYFEYYKEKFQPFFEAEWTHLADCTCRSVELQAELFGLDTSLTRVSTLEGDALSSVEGVVQAFEADTLVVPSSSKHPSDVGVQVKSFEYEHPTYHQNFEGFVPEMTGMDLLFNYGREAPRVLENGIVPSASD